MYQLHCIKRFNAILEFFNFKYGTINDRFNVPCYLLKQCTLIRIHTLETNSLKVQNSGIYFLSTANL